MLGLCLGLGFVGGVAALAGLIFAGAPVWLAVLGFSLGGSLVTGGAAWVGYRLTLPPTERPATRLVGPIELQPIRVRR